MVLDRLVHAFDRSCEEGLAEGKSVRVDQHPHVVTNQRRAGAMCRHDAVGTTAEHVEIAVPEGWLAGRERGECRCLVRVDGGHRRLQHCLGLLRGAEILRQCRPGTKRQRQHRRRPKLAHHCPPEAAAHPSGGPGCHAMVVGDCGAVKPAEVPVRGARPLPGACTFAIAGPPTAQP
jgi:hypothetical protein